MFYGAGVRLYIFMIAMKVDMGIAGKEENAIEVDDLNYTNYRWG